MISETYFDVQTVPCMKVVFQQISSITEAKILTSDRLKIRPHRDQIPSVILKGILYNGHLRNILYCILT